MSFEARRFPASMPVWLFATGYFALNALTRVLAASTAGLDQAEQLVLSQDRWGYGPTVARYVQFAAMAIGRIRGYFGLAVALMLAAAAMLPGRTLRHNGLSIFPVHILPMCIGGRKCVARSA